MNSFSLTKRTPSKRIACCSFPLTVLIAGLLSRIDVPNDVIGQADDLVTSALGHFGKPLRLRLVLEGV